MSRQYHSTAPKARRNPLDQGDRTVRAIYQVIDTSDGDTVIETFRNKVLADRKALLSPAYYVCEVSIDALLKENHDA